MDGNRSSIERNSTSRVGSGAQPPRLSPSASEAAPASVESALRDVRPDDLDAILDGALFGPPGLEVSGQGATGGAPAATPVPVGAMNWYIERHEQPVGPFRLERLRELWHQGELSPDTLFWCEVWSTWMPLSRVPELVAALTIAGLPTVAADASVSTAPGRAKEAGSGKKGVSALHSLVEDEVMWLRKMREEKELAREEARSTSLDAPSAPVPAPAPVQPVMAPVPAQVLPVAPPPGPGMPMAPPLVPAMMAAPVAPEAPAPARRSKALLAGVLMGSAAVGLITGAVLLLPQVRRAPEQVAKDSPRLDAPVALPATPAPVPEAAPVAPPAPAAATPTPEAREAKTVTAPAPPETPKPAVVAAPAPVEQKEGSGRRVASLRQAEAPSASEERIARAASPVKAGGRKTLESDTPADDSTHFEDSIDKEFEKELGFSKGAPKYKAEDPRSKRNVYIPPEPGKDLPESLSTSDIVQVVGSHKAAILSCIETYKPARMSDSGKDRFVVRWRVLPTGDAVEALLETESLKGTPFARCIEGQVRSWKFPRHRVQSREPVRFPFTY